MDIPQALPQFTNTKTVIIASGAQVGKVYFAENGVIELHHSFEEQTPTYSDKEGLFGKPTPNGVMAGGAPREHDDTELQKQYSKELAEGLSQIHKETGIDELYLFAPEYMQQVLRAVLPRELQDRLQGTYHGNLVEAHPTDLLERLQKKNTSTD